MLCGLGCRVTIVAPEVHEVARAAVAAGRLSWERRPYSPGDCKSFQLVVAATDRREVNRAVFEEARASGIPVNVVDDPELCTAIFPAVLRDGPLTVAVSTSGIAPFMASEVRNRISASLGSTGRWTEAAGRFRTAVRARFSDPADRARWYTRFTEAVRPDRAPDPPAGDNFEDWAQWLETLGNS
jgi:uroporphyrin-III C-methyltransferase/precorrin-2 dehydrogenase/sirohydrochlorin ferrochelatase